MAINYERLNDNTLDNIYKILNKDELVNCIQKVRYFFKFDSKNEFWQTQLHEESISQITFSCSKRHFEWLVMPFSLKHIPIGQNFKTVFKFYTVYIDNIFVFS